MDWTEEVIEQLKALWAEGHSTAEIGRRMGISKNAVVGKAHRLHLAARPSPIRREEGEARTAPPRRVTGPTLPPLAATPAQATVPVAASLPPVVKPIPAVAEAPKPVAPPAPIAAAPVSTVAPVESRPVLRPTPVLKPVATRFTRRVATCCWPIGEPGTSAFHFCDADAVQGRPYCAEHVQLAYVKVRDRREDAA